MSVFNIGQTIDGYTIQSVIKINEYTETYRAADAREEAYFLKVYVLKRTPERLVNPETHEVYTIERCRNLQHANVISYIASGKIQAQSGECHYLITSYFTGDILTDLVQRKGALPTDQAIAIYKGILEGLQYLHDQQLCHNDITPSNIMLNNAAGGIPEIIDMGHTAPRCQGKVPFEIADLELFYCANETLAGLYDEQSDVFSASAVFYYMLAGKAPWQMDFTPSMSRTRRFTLLKEHRKNEELDLSGLDIEEYLQNILRKGLAANYHDRYQSVSSILSALEGRQETEAKATPSGDGHQRRQRTAKPEQQSPNEVSFEISHAKGKGFADIAGMSELKAVLQQKVIFVLKNKELAEKYRLTPPNGLLLYGPPGCGKTFFAEKFAEETGFNFMMVKSSDLASVYVHGSQEKIGKLFKQAESKKPAILCFDEFDALVPNRTNIDNPSMSGEVNEFLSQLNNCAQRGIFVIATSNRPDKIDPAVLRTGRIDKQVYVPLPDVDARREMFQLHLKDRPFNPDEIDFEQLAKRTDGYIASDIAYIVNDAAMTAAFTSQPITQELLETSLSNTRPSIRKDSISLYDKIREQMENTERRNLDRPRIGFH